MYVCMMGLCEGDQEWCSGEGPTERTRDPVDWTLLGRGSI